MSTPWLRLWVDMPNDPKWRTIARASKQAIPSVMAVYLHILVNASNADERGRTQNVCNEDIASALDLDCEQVDAIIEAMQGRVLDGDKVRGWEKRQPLREDGASERAKAWREAQKGKNKPNPSAPKAPPNAPERTPNAGKRSEVDTDTDTDTDIDIDKTRHAVAIEDGEEAGNSSVSRRAAICMVIKAEGIGAVNPQHPDLLALVERGADVGHFAAAAKVAKTKGKGFAYLLGVVKGQMGDAEKLAITQQTPPTPTSGSSRQPLSFAERDRIAGMQRWEEGSNQRHPDLPEEFSKFRSTGNVIDITPNDVRIAQ